MAAKRASQNGRKRVFHLRDARRRKDVTTTVLNATRPPTMAIPMYPSDMGVKWEQGRDEELYEYEGLVGAYLESLGRL